MDGARRTRSTTATPGPSRGPGWRWPATGALILALAGPGCGLVGGTDLEVDATVRRLDLEGGCWVLQTDSVSYEPTGLPPEFRQDGLAVQAGLDLRSDLGSFCMVGPIVDVDWIRRR
jgi:hypothetical protein